MTMPAIWRLSFMSIALVSCAALIACDAGGGGGRRRHLSDTGRSVFFTDHRGLDQPHALTRRPPLVYQ